MRSGVRRQAISAALSLGILAGLERPARADTDGGTVAAVAVVVGFVIADITFGVYDIGSAANGSLPAKPWAIAEAVVTTPEAVVAGGLLGVFSNERAWETDPRTLLLVFPASVFGSLSAHGIWGAATDRIPPAVLFGASPLIGTNVALTSFAIGRAAFGHLGGRPFGVLETVLTAPQVALGGVQASRDAANRPGWIALSAWSGALLVHGIASIIAGPHETPPPEPPPPPPPRPTPPEEEKPPLKVPYPYTIRFGPMLVTDGVARAPGMGVVGAF